MAKPLVLPETEVIERERVVPLYRVVLLDDNDHTYDYVIEMLQKIFISAPGRRVTHPPYYWGMRFLELCRPWAWPAFCLPRRPRRSPPRRLSRQPRFRSRSLRPGPCLAVPPGQVVIAIGDIRITAGNSIG